MFIGFKSYKILSFFLLVILWMSCTQVSRITQTFYNPKPGNFLQDSVKVFKLYNKADDYSITNVDSALIFGYQALQLARKIKDRKGEALTLINLGKIFRNLGDYPKALELYFQSLKISESIGFEIGICSNYVFIGDAFSIQSDYNQALIYYKKSEAIARSLPYYNVLIRVYLGRGKLFEQRNQLDSSVYWVEKARGLLNKPNLGFLGQYIYLELGNIFLKRKNLDQAFLNYQTCLRNSLKSEWVYSSAVLGLAKLNEEKGNRDSSLTYAYQSLSIADQNKFALQHLEASSFLRDYYKKAGRFDSAFKFQEIAISAKDSLFSQQKLLRFASVSYNEKIRDQEIKESETLYRNQVRFYILLGGLITLIILALILYRNNLQKQRANVQLTAQKNEIDDQRIKIVEAYEDLKTTQYQLVQAEKMASLAEFTLGIAHEIQNPLNFLTNFSEMSRELALELKDDFLAGNSKNILSLAEEIIENNERINHHGNRADRIVKTMLQHSGRISGKVEPNDMNVLIRECLGMARSNLSLNQDIKPVIHTEWDENLPLLKVSRQDIGSVIVNILNNAYYALGERKVSESNFFEPHIFVKTLQKNGNLEIRIRDNAKGISPKILDKIFQPFFTTKPTGDGTGLGLSLSYDIIKSHSGDIQVFSKENEGTEFVISIPIQKNL